ncbi:hypothetical protein [Hymenobacter lucidus]|uniref:Tyr recombinase domain-containing protein n=1 Tax=Hymenobacter lucidus TaxID=2880930 RepID=A0ABS8AY65_9BACT|nr:hypothetical protein [Hymenobacter lucidus]MCB2410756.1 hypothetical protein [Hymenobacter lucidus]
MQRLIDPIEAVFAYCCSPDEGAKISYSCCVLLLREIHERQSTLWAWDEGIWLEIVGKSQQDFINRHKAFQEERFLSRINLRHYIISCAYLLGNIDIHPLITDCVVASSARSILGYSEVVEGLQTVQAALARVGKVKYWNIVGLSTCVSLALLLNRSPFLEDLTMTVIEQTYEQASLSKGLKQGCIALAQALYSLSILPEPFEPELPKPPRIPRAIVCSNKPKDTLPTAWVESISRWSALTWAGKRTIAAQRSRIAKAGRWAAAKYPTAAHPAQWTAGMAKEFVETISEAAVGDWNRQKRKRAACPGEKMRPAVRAQIINAVRCFFTDCQAADVLPVAFSPAVYLKTPAKLIKACGPNPRPIEWQVWKKLEHACLSLTHTDLPSATDSWKADQREAAYPLEMVRALAAVWIFAGLRGDEIRRLIVGCTHGLSLRRRPLSNQRSMDGGIIDLHVPKNKSGDAFEKTVDARLRKPIEAWEKRRPTTPKQRDETTGELVNLLFTWDGFSINRSYINRVLIPLLCRKAGISECDTLGQITCHRGRATLATQLHCADVPTEHIQDWLGHYTTRSTGFYIAANGEAVADSIRSAIQIIKSEPPALDHIALPDDIPDSIEIKDTSKPIDSLDHLRIKPRKTDQDLALAARHSLSQVQQKLLLSRDQREVFAFAMSLLTTIAVHP